MTEQPMQLRSAEQSTSAVHPIPEAWRNQGYTGRFMVMIRMVNDGTDEPATPERVAVQAEKMPYEIGSGWLALAVEELDGYPQMVLVRKDMSAVGDLFFGVATDPIPGTAK